MKTSKKEMATTASGRRVAVMVQSEGVNFACRGVLKYRGKTIAEGPTRPHGNRAAAHDDAIGLLARN